MAINKGTLSRETSTGIEYLYPKTSSDIVIYDSETMLNEAIASAQALADRVTVLENTMNSLSPKLTALTGTPSLSIDPPDSELICLRGIQEYTLVATQESSGKYVARFRFHLYVAKGYNLKYYYYLINKTGAFGTMDEFNASHEIQEDGTVKILDNRCSISYYQNRIPAKDLYGSDGTTTTYAMLYSDGGVRNAYDVKIHYDTLTLNATNPADESYVFIKGVLVTEDAHTKKLKIYTDADSVYFTQAEAEQYTV